MAGVAAWGLVPAVAGAAWSAPQDVVPASSLTDGHRALAVDARGTAIALLGYGGDLRYAEQPASGPWSGPGSLGPAFGAGLTVTPAEALVVWSDGLGDAPRILSASRTLEGVWSPPVDVARAPSRYARIMGLSANARGDAVVSVVDTHSASTPSIALSRTARGPWGPLDLGPAAPWARVVLDDTGAMTAVWREDAPDQSPGTGRVRLAQRAAGGGFVEIPSPTGQESVVIDSVGVTAGGDALLVASPASLSAQTAWLRPAGGAFGPPRVIRGRFWGEGSAAIGDDGTAALAWGAPADGAPLREIRAVVRPPGGVFGSPAVVATLPRPDGVTGPLVAVGSDGGVVVAWSQLRPTGVGRRVAGTVWAAIRPPGGTAFGPAVALGDRALPSMLSRVAAGTGGAAVVTWIASTGRGYALQAARNERSPLIARLTATSDAGGARIRIRLGDRARVAVRLLRPTGRVAARRTRSLPAGASTLVVARPGALTRGRYRVQVSARGADRSAAASARLAVPGTP